MKNLFIITLLLTFCLTSFSQESKWLKTKKKNTIDSYQKFLKKYPDSEYSENALLKIIDLEYNIVKKDSTIESFSNFILKYPESIQTTEAKEKLMQLEYIHAKDANKTLVYKEFLKKYPKSGFTNEINNYLIISYFNEQPNIPDSKNNWQKFRQSFYYNSYNLSNNSAKKEIKEILANEYDINYNLFSSVIAEILKVSKASSNSSYGNTSKKEEYTNEIKALTKKLNTISHIRPICDNNYDVLNVYSTFFEILEELIVSSKHMSLVEGMSYNICGHIYLRVFTAYDFKSNTPKTIPFYGRTDEWSSQDKSVIKFKNNGLDMLEYHTNKVTAARFVKLYKALEQEEKNVNLKERLLNLIKKAEQLSIKE